ncbi:MAG: asparagine--tRNA ligase [Defluviitaleaceae bacterium]|nr:asparagine--tRNA ligase [Defluviitaleaceae bacterium]MCL2836787.1 asparagine--tRNA ligase [Defluviitaleaceae bacterium]
MRVRVKEIYDAHEKFMGREITMGGWVRTLRDSKSFAFLALHDGSHFKSLQVVMDNNTENYMEAVKLGVGSAVSVTGELVESEGREQAVELKAKSITVESAAPSDYPLQKKRHTNEFLRTIAHLRPRTNTFQAVFRVRTEASYAVHKFFRDRGFVYVHTPVIATSDCEGAGEMFQITTMDLNNVPKKDGAVDYSRDFFGKQVFLNVSGQINVEPYCLAFSDVYTFGPTFRAENSNTPRHAAEFWMMEPEIAFADLNDNMQLAEDMLKYLISHLLENCKPEMAFFNEFIDKELFARLDNVVSSEFGRVTYTEAIDLLLKSNQKFEFPVKWGMDIQTEHERYIAEKIYKRPVFVTDYPKEIKSFYMRRNDDGKTVAAMDLLAPGVGEIIGGSQREERLDILLECMREKNLNEEDYWWYLELRRYGGVKHAGFGLGFERFLMYVTGMQNIRDVIPYPRTAKNAEF